VKVLGVSLEEGRALVYGGRDLWIMRVLSRGWKSEGVKDDECGESEEDDVTGVGRGESETERHGWGWRREARSWFQGSRFCCIVLSRRDNHVSPTASYPVPEVPGGLVNPTGDGRAWSPRRGAAVCCPCIVAVYDRWTNRCRSALAACR